jgi:hypothetical protein
MSAQREDQGAQVSAVRRGRGKAAGAVLALLLTAIPAAAQGVKAQDFKVQDFKVQDFKVQDLVVPGLNPGEPPTAVTAPPPTDHDTIQVPSGGRPFVVAQVDRIPRQLKTAIERSNCSLAEALVAKYLVLIFRPADGRRLMAMVPCFGTTPDSRAFLFDRSVEMEPSLMTFPVVAPTGGFSASSRPGLMTWEAQTQTLTAWRGSDVCPARELRHTYRQGSGELNGFALSKVEHRRLRCTTPEAGWQTLWQSPAWNLPP